MNPFRTLIEELASPRVPIRTIREAFDISENVRPEHASEIRSAAQAAIDRIGVQPQMERVTA